MTTQVMRSLCDYGHTHRSVDDVAVAPDLVAFDGEHDRGGHAVELPVPHRCLRRRLRRRRVEIWFTETRDN